MDFTAKVTNHAGWIKEVEALCERLKAADFKLQGTRLDSYRKTFGTINKFITENREYELPNKIPLPIFLNDLHESQELSIPQMWVPTVTAVESDPVLRGRYQFWAFAYPTGDPIVLSALRLRESLAQVYQLYPKTKDVVLISHSMGGLLSQMQAVTTGRVLWDRVFRSYADRLYTALPPDNVVKRASNARQRLRILLSILACAFKLIGKI